MINGCYNIGVVPDAQSYAAAMQKYKQQEALYNEAYGIAYAFGLEAPRKQDFESGNGEAIVDRYAELAYQKNPNTSNTQVLARIAKINSERNAATAAKTATTAATSATTPATTAPATTTTTEKKNNTIWWIVLGGAVAFGAYKLLSGGKKKRR